MTYRLDWQLRPFDASITCTMPQSLYLEIERYADNIGTTKTVIARVLLQHGLLAATEKLDQFAELLAAPKKDPQELLEAYRAIFDTS